MWLTNSKLINGSIYNGEVASFTLEVVKRVPVWTNKNEKKRCEIQRSQTALVKANKL